MRHPDSAAVGDAAENRGIRRRNIEYGKSELAFNARTHIPAEEVGDELLSVANSEDRNPGAQKGGFDGRTG